MTASLVRKYFDSIATNYAGDWTDLNVGYPLMKVRSEHALKWMRSKITQKGGWILDLGCGPGYFLELLINFGYRAHGLDIAPAMVGQAFARLKVRKVLADRFRLETADATLWRSPHRFSGVAALGVLEYLPDDTDLFQTANRALPIGGAFIVECRNRLFNLFSLNEYTRTSLKKGEYGEMLEEYQELSRSPVLRPFKNVVGDMANSVRRSMSWVSKKSRPRTTPSQQHSEIFSALPRRQHGPLRLAEGAARSCGFELDYLRFLHFHPFPPALEKEDTRFFRGLGLALELAGDTYASSAMSSSFLAGFIKKKEVEDL